MILLPEPGPKPNGPSTLAGLPAPFRSLDTVLSNALTVRNIEDISALNAKIESNIASMAVIIEAATI